MIHGQWAINANNYLGKLEFRAEGAGLAGRVWFDVHQKWEALTNISFDNGSGLLQFTRPEPGQRYTGRLSGNQITGTFDQGGAGSYQWQASQSSISQKGQPADPSSNTQTAGTVFDNWNKSVVNNRPKKSTQFNIDQTATITSIMTYHWNNGMVKQPGFIHLIGGDGMIYGPWRATGTSGTGGAQNVNWIVKPNVTLSAGSYIIVDSDHSTWSHNPLSDGSGFSNVAGH